MQQLELLEPQSQLETRLFREHNCRSLLPIRGKLFQVQQTGTTLGQYPKSLPCPEQNEG